jgi:undecaprenyl-diphosphatase
MNDTLLFLINGWAGKSSVLDAIMVFCASYLIYIVFIVALICVGLLALKKEWKTVIYFAATLIVSFALLQLASHLYVDNRPFVDHQLHQIVAHATGKSFPSDHTTATTALAIAILFFTRFKKTGIAILISALVIGFARVFVGVHYPIDILGGLITGVVGGAIVFGIKKIVDSRNPKKQTASDDQTE